MKKIVIMIITAIALNMIILSGSSLVFAQDQEINITETTFNVTEYLTTKGQTQEYFGTGDGGTCTNKGGPISCFILTTINYATKIIGSIAVLLLIISGFMIMLAQGNQQKLDEAKDITKYAVIGLVLTFLAYIITIFVQGLFLTN